jgi:hypothetical protein
MSKLQASLAETCPREIYAVMVMVGKSVCWPCFTPDKDIAEYVAEHQSTVNGVFGVVVGPIGLCCNGDCQSRVSVADLIGSLNDTKQEEVLV